MKKIISIVLSAVFAVGASMSAMAYTDVSAGTANAQAIQELTDLKIIEGYTDNEFKPEGLVTRAEVTKMVVAALAQTAAADAAKGATAFSDVAADHWASGFINVGSSS
ncbi:MAG: S-layer homology domain-containing protein, partial [Erysipelotrichaceae bacterium]|nr:S-layer homology domain-containing protein [Erysipelotrichaceae bacterium]